MQMTLLLFFEKFLLLLLQLQQLGFIYKNGQDLTRCVTRNQRLNTRYQRTKGGSSSRSRHRRHRRDDIFLQHYRKFFRETRILSSLSISINSDSSVATQATSLSLSLTHTFSLPPSISITLVEIDRSSNE